LSDLSFDQWINIFRLIASVATPICVAIFAFGLNRRLKSIDDAQWQSRKIVERRLEIYDYVAPRVNEIFCFMMGFGDWKEISPEKILKSKRELDKQVNVYRYLLSEDFYTAYDEFIHAVFETFTGRGQDAKIKALISEEWGDRDQHTNYDWDPKFEKLFSKEQPSAVSTLQILYNKTMVEFQKCIGI
jgi:hypothetical protein